MTERDEQVMTTAHSLRINNYKHAVGHILAAFLIPALAAAAIYVEFLAPDNWMVSDLTELHWAVALGFAIAWFRTRGRPFWVEFGDTIRVRTLTGVQDLGWNSVRAIDVGRESDVAARHWLLMKTTTGIWRVTVSGRDKAALAELLRDKALALYAKKPRRSWANQIDLILELLGR